MTSNKLIDYFVKSKDINIMCFCKKRLWGSSIIILEPCEHLAHEKCVKNIKQCPICKTKIDKIITEKILMKELHDKHTFELWQKYIDVLTVKGYSSPGNNDPALFFTRLDSLINTSVKFLYSINYDDASRVINKLIDDCNIKINIIDKHKLNNSAKVYIVNHTSYLDGYIIDRVCDCRFISSNLILKTALGRKIAKLANMIILDRGKNGSNTVNTMKENLKKGYSITIFPEGMITSPKTLSKFRTGAFMTGFPVQPLLMKYDNPIQSEKASFLYYILSQKELNITITVLDVCHGPFDKRKIEAIRHDMACKGNMMLSRVSNRGLIEDD